MTADQFWFESSQCDQIKLKMIKRSVFQDKIFLSSYSPKEYKSTKKISIERRIDFSCNKSYVTFQC